jgi:hypothetical protein
MKRIVRLTESDLTRIVKRVINEQSFFDQMMADAKKQMASPTYLGKSAATDFIAALSGTFDDSEADALTAINRLKNKLDLGAFSSEITRVKGGTFCKYLNSEMSNADDEYEKIISKVKSLGGPDCWDSSGWNNFMIAFKDTIKNAGNSSRY